MPQCTITIVSGPKGKSTMLAMYQCWDPSAESFTVRSQQELNAALESFSRTTVIIVCEGFAPELDSKFEELPVSIFFITLDRL